MTWLLWILLLQGIIGHGPARGLQWDWARLPDEAPVRASWVITEAEQAVGCFVAATWFDDHMVQIHCPAPFTPYGVTFQRYCVVKEGELFVKARVVIIPKDGSRQLFSCEVKKADEREN